MARDKEKYNAYQRTYQLRRYHARRAKYIAQLGGKCIDCGSVENLELDHVDPSTKEFTISGSLWSRSEEFIEKEVKKCVLRCISCHSRKTWREVKNKIYLCCNIEFSKMAYRAHKKMV